MKIEVGDILVATGLPGVGFLAWLAEREAMMKRDPDRVFGPRWPLWAAPLGERKAFPVSPNGATLRISYTRHRETLSGPRPLRFIVRGLLCLDDAGRSGPARAVEMNGVQVTGYFRHATPEERAKAEPLFADFDQARLAAAFWPSTEGK